MKNQPNLSPCLQFCRYLKTCIGQELVPEGERAGFELLFTPIL